jgi:hypothetical protein
MWIGGNRRSCIYTQTAQIEPTTEASELGLERAIPQGSAERQTKSRANKKTRAVTVTALAAAPSNWKAANLKQNRDHQVVRA